MAIISSSPTSITVRNPPAPGTSPLSMLAASMAPGTWAQLVVQNQNALLGVGESSGSMLPYCNSMPWNPVAGRIEILGRDHNYSAGGMRYVQYVEATNEFVLIHSSTPGLEGLGHGYDHSTVNPNTGDLYTRRYNGGTTPLRTFRKLNNSTAFTELTPVLGSDYLHVALGSCWWSGSFVGGGAEGSWMVFVSNTGGPTNGKIVAYNPLTSTWFYSQGSRAPNGSGSYHVVMEYSARKNVAVYGGGNGDGNRLWRMDSSGTVVELTNVPAGKNVGSGTGQGKLVSEPVTGNFLLLSAGQLWELNPNGAGTWTQLSTPPSAIAQSVGVVGVSIEDYGVVAYISQPTPTGGSFYLYKRA